MAPHHHLRSSFIANPVLFSFPATAPTVASPARTAVLAREALTPRGAQRRVVAPPRNGTSALSTCAGGVDHAGTSPLPLSSIKEKNVMEPFWKGLKDGTIEARNRARGERGALEEGEGRDMRRDMGRERKRALVFAGLGSYPHQPSSPTEASLRLWERASEALVTPCPEIGYVPRAIEQEKSTMRGSLGDGMDPALWRRWNKGWLRGWVGNRSINELMSRPDIKAAYVITSNLAILASAQSHSPEPTSFLPQDVTHLLGYGFIGTLTALVATDKVKLEDAIRLACIYASLPAGGETSLVGQGGGTVNRHWMTTLLTLSHDTSRTRKYSLSDAVPHHYPRHLATTTAAGVSPLAHVLDVIRDLQEHEGWNENLLPMCAQTEDEGYGVHADSGDWSTREWAGEAMINSPRTLVVSGTKGAVIKIIDRLRGGGLATPVMDLHMPCPYHTPIMRGSVFQFRQALKGCPFHPAGGANGLTGKCEPDVVILDGMTAKPLPMDDIPNALTAYLTRPLQWAQTTRSLWAPAYEGNGTPVVDEISIVGRGARGLGIAIDREIGEARRMREQQARVQQRVKETQKGVLVPSASSSAPGPRSVGKYQAGRGSSRRRTGGNVFPMTADVGDDEAGSKGVRVVEYDFEERR